MDILTSFACGASQPGTPAKYSTDCGESADAMPQLVIWGVAAAVVVVAVVVAVVIVKKKRKNKKR